MATAGRGPTPAQAFCGLVGVVLIAAGALGFIGDASFGGPDERGTFLGLDVNGWHNIVHIATGAIGLLVAGYAARQYALYLGIVYLVIAAWGFIIGNGDSILGFIPVNTEDNFLHLILGALGVGAAMATPVEGARPVAAT